MSENQKYLNLIRVGGGRSAIFKNVWNSKKSEISDRGGGQAYLGIFPKFFRFFLWWLPLEVAFNSRYLFRPLAGIIQPHKIYLFVYMDTCGPPFMYYIKESLKNKWRLRQGSSGILPKLPWRSPQLKSFSLMKVLTQTCIQEYDSAAWPWVT